MIARLAIAVLCLFAVGAILILLIHRIGRSGSARVNSDWIKYGVFLGVVIAFLASAFIGRPVFCLLLGVLVAAVGAELWSNFKGHSGHGTFAAGCITAIIAVGLAHLLFFRSEEWFASCAFVLLLVFVTDSYAQLIGRLAGRHRLCPRISPNKTVEGFLGGVVMAVVSALIFSFILPRITLNQIVVLGIVTALSATAGDLIFSAVKRKIGVKDFSGFIPGHGGVLDRIDSLIFASPVFFWAKTVLDHMPGGAS